MYLVKEKIRFNKIYVTNIGKQNTVQIFLFLVTRIIASKVLSFADDLQKFYFFLEIKTTQLLTLKKKRM